MCWPLDPFEIKQLSKLHPKRLLYTAQARFQEWRSKRMFGDGRIPEIVPPISVGNLEWPQADTAVTKNQAAVLLAGLRSTEELGGRVVEIGSYRGVTTALLASHTNRRVVAVDPFIGYGGAEADMVHLSQRIEHLPNAEHKRCTSGAAARQMTGQSISFVFIDAVHDYVNARFDAAAWTSLLAPGGVVTFHDADALVFAGVQRVLVELLRDTCRFELLYHVSGVVAIRKIARG